MRKGGSIFPANTRGAVFAGQLSLKWQKTHSMQAIVTVGIASGIQFPQLFPLLLTYFAVFRLHGAPYQWAAIVHKDAVLFTEGQKELLFYNSSDKATAHKLPCKVYCSKCRAPLADEGRNMMLMFPSAIHFEDGVIPEECLELWRRTHHMFYGSRIADVLDGIPKYLGKKGDRPYSGAE
ncbi:hypothetical protein M0805_002169 [Coniferiporia weirii]|nr:hypothetical protein M0805_002169 [Coniferiporia weirii]